MSSIVAGPKSSDHPESFAKCHSASTTHLNESCESKRCCLSLMSFPPPPRTPLPPSLSTEICGSRIVVRIALLAVASESEANGSTRGPGFEQSAWRSNDRSMSQVHEARACCCFFSLSVHAECIVHSCCWRRAFRHLLCCCAHGATCPFSSSETSTKSRSSMSNAVSDRLSKAQYAALALSRHLPPLFEPATVALSMMASISYCLWRCVRTKRWKARTSSEPSEGTESE